MTGRLDIRTDFVTLGANYNSKIWDMLRYQEEAADLQWSAYVVDTPGIPVENMVVIHVDRPGS